MSETARRKVILASPKEPCGATWLINCLLMLGVMTYRDLSIGMWVPRQGHYILNKHNKGLKKWLPVLSERENFTFREDVEVQWTHEWPNLKHRQQQILFFSRDPRDALFSACKRDSPEMSFKEYLRFPDTVSLLDRVDNHLLHARCWLGQQNVSVVRFEDYKTDARQTLVNVLDCIGVDATNQEIEAAVAASTFEKAAQAEKRYREEHPEDQRFICRSGTVGDFKQQGLDEDEIANIEQRCASLLHRLGYSCDLASDVLSVSYREITRRLSFFKNVDLPKGVLGSEESPEVVFDVDNMLSQDADVLRRRNLSYYDYVVLVRSIEEYCNTKPIRLALSKKQVWEDKKKYLDMVRVIIEHPLSKSLKLSDRAMKNYFRMRAFLS